MHHETCQNITFHDKTHKYLKFDYFTSLCVVDRICIFISSKMAAQYMYASERSLVIWVLKLTKLYQPTKLRLEAQMYCATIFELIKIQIRSATQSEVR